MFPVPEREFVEDRHAERLQVLLEHVLERSRARPLRRFAHVSVVAVLHLADHNTGRLLELAGVLELIEEAVEEIRRELHVLEEEDRALELDLPGRAHRLNQEPEAASDERSGHLPRADRAYIGIVGIAWDVARPAGAQHVE